MAPFFIVSAAIFINGSAFDKVHIDEYAYADVLADYRRKQSAYTAEHDKLATDAMQEYTKARSTYMLAFTRIEDQWRVIAKDEREEWKLGAREMPPMDPFTRARTPLDTEEEKAIRMSVAKEQIMKLGPPPPKPDTTYMPFQFVADKADLAFLIKHSAKVRAFLAGTEGWDNLFFENDFSLCEGKVFMQWERESIRLACLALFSIPGVSRPPLPSVKEFVAVLKLTYPK